MLCWLPTAASRKALARQDGAVCGLGNQVWHTVVQRHQKARGSRREPGPCVGPTTIWEGRKRGMARKKVSDD